MGPVAQEKKRWCEKEGGFMFSRAGKNKVSSKQLENIERSLLLNESEGLERNRIGDLLHLQSDRQGTRSISEAIGHSLFVLHFQ